VFDRFYQVGKKHLEFGSGIGLHIVSQYVNLLHGKITLTDNQPCGTCFCFSLPIILNQQEKTADDDAETTIATNAVDHNKRPRILLVEDNEDFLSFLDECLNGDYSISKAANGAEALSVLQQQDINLVISDIMMPVMDGLELCRKIKTDIALSHIPVVLLTARSTEEHRIEGLRDGADDYITKPFNLNILKLRIEKILEWGKQNHEKFTNKMDVKPNEITISSLDEMLIKKAIQAVEDNMDNSEFTVEDLGRAVGLSRGHLYRKIMSITGSGPLEFIRILRLKRAKQYLEKSQMSVSEIAYLVGFNTPKNFSKCFKDEFHLTPSEYKEQSVHKDGMQ
jgi:DNA-binding response OmpR family regulator